MEMTFSYFTTKEGRERAEGDGKAVMGEGDGECLARRNSVCERLR